MERLSLERWLGKALPKSRSSRASFLLRASALKRGIGLQQCMFLLHCLASAEEAILKLA